jgi:hypothetical protein
MRQSRALIQLEISIYKQKEIEGIDRMMEGGWSKRTKELQTYKAKCYMTNLLLISTLQLHICVSVERNVTNRVGEILGFGETIEGNTKMPCTLQRAYIQIFTMKQCNESELPSRISTPRVLCAGVIDGGVDSCQVRTTTQGTTSISYSYSCSKNSTIL